MTEPDAPPILVFQMAKVASRSWLRLLSQNFPDRTLAHFHALSPRSVALIGHVVAAKGPEQTIEHMSLPRLGRPPESIERYVSNGVWIGPPTQIVAGVRDPVARAVSVVGFLTNRLGHKSRAVTVRSGGTAENLAALFFAVLRAAQDGADSADTLIQVLAHAVFDYRRWFQEELSPAFGLDALSQPFRRETGYLRLDGRHRLFVYRVEDLMQPDASRLLMAGAADFFGRELGLAPMDDVSGEARYRALYGEFVKRVRLSPADLDWFYDHPIVAHFYAPDEVAAFRRRWAA